MNLTVVLCSYNRGESLARALNSAAALTVPESIGWQILVVDNNSTDHTSEVCEEFCRRYPDRFHYLFEPQQGLSYARNAGVREARGDIIVFMDDDVTVEPTWLHNLTAELHGGEWAGAGGRVLPLWTCPPPRWLPREGRYALAPLTVFDMGAEAGELTEAPFGANMAFRKEMFQKYGGFRTDLGRRPGTLIGNEDTEFGKRLLMGGERLRYEPSALMYHPVQEARIQKDYFLAWWFDKSRADVMEFGIPRDAKWHIWAVSLDQFLRLAMSTLRWMIAMGPSRRFSRKLNVWKVAGRIVECYRQALERKRKMHGGSPVTSR